jgi:ATP-dependent RNA helicase TDRD9
MFEVVQLHSTTLNSDITNRLYEVDRRYVKVIVATNIAESSITVPGVKYIIDFCATKEVRYSSRSRLENLELIWASQASCNQRAGRTGRVCDGFVFRMIEKSFFDKLDKYSTPEIQRSSLDRLILRIKLLH